MFTIPLKLKFIIGAVTLAAAVGATALGVSRHYDRKIAALEAAHQSAASKHAEMATLKQGEADAYARQRDAAYIELAASRQRERRSLAKVAELESHQLPTLAGVRTLEECEKQFTALSDGCIQVTGALHVALEDCQGTNKILGDVNDLQTKENGALRTSLIERVTLDQERVEQINAVGKRAQKEATRANWWRTGFIGATAALVIEVLRKK